MMPKGWLLYILFSFSTMQLQAVIILPLFPAQTALDWSGIDEYDGDGSEHFTYIGEQITATLTVLCNRYSGYSLYLSSPTAHKKRRAYLENGSDQIEYRISMDTSGVHQANITRENLNLKNDNQADLSVNFYGGSLPRHGGFSGNVIQLHLTLRDSNSGSQRLHTMGTYTDQITATIAMN